MMEAPFFIYNSTQMGPALGDIGCRIYGFTGAISGTASICTLTAISIDRYYVVVYPLNPKTKTTKIRCYLMITFIWIFSTCFSVIPLLEIGLTRYTYEGFFTACGYDYLDKTRDGRIFIFIFCISAYLLPLTIIAYCYIHILKVVITARKSIQSSRNKNKTEIKLAGVVVAIVALWIIAWTPYTVVSVIGIFGYEDHLTMLSSMIPAICAKTSACINPYFYAMNHPRYRKELTRIFCGVWQERQENSVSQFTRNGTSIRGGRYESGYVDNKHQNPSSAQKRRMMISRRDTSTDTSMEYSIDLPEIPFKVIAPK